MSKSLHALAHRQALSTGTLSAQLTALRLSATALLIAAEDDPAEANALLRNVASSVSSATDQTTEANGQLSHATSLVSSVEANALLRNSTSLVTPSATNTHGLLGHATSPAAADAASRLDLLQLHLQALRVDVCVLLLTSSANAPAQGSLPHTQPRRYTIYLHTHAHTNKHTRMYIEYHNWNCFPSRQILLYRDFLLTLTVKVYSSTPV